MKDLRDEKGLKQADLAEKTGFSREHIARIESKEGGSWVSEEFVSALATAFDVAETRLFLDPDCVPSPSNRQILETINTALMERDMLRNLQRQGIIPTTGSPQWKEMLRAGLKNRHVIETSEEQVGRRIHGMTIEASSADPIGGNSVSARQELRNLQLKADAERLKKEEQALSDEAGQVEERPHQVLAEYVGKAKAAEDPWLEKMAKVTDPEVRHRVEQVLEAYTEPTQESAQPADKGMGRKKE